MSTDTAYFDDILNSILAKDDSAAMQEVKPDLFDAKYTFSLIVIRLFHYHANDIYKVGLKSNATNIPALIFEMRNYAAGDVKAVMDLVKNDLGLLKALVATNGAKFVSKDRTNAKAKDLAKTFESRIAIKDIDARDKTVNASEITWGRVSIIFALSCAEAIEKRFTNPISVTANVPHCLGTTGFSSLLYHADAKVMEKIIMISRAHNINMSKVLDRKHENKIAASNADYDSRGYPYLMNGFNTSHYSVQQRESFTNSLQINGRNWIDIVKNLTEAEMKNIYDFVSDSTRTTAAPAAKK